MCTKGKYFSVIQNLPPNSQYFQIVNQHAEDKCIIHNTKHKSDQSEIPKHISVPFY